MDKQTIFSELKKGMEVAICEMELQEQSIAQMEEVLHRYLDVIKGIFPDVNITQISDTNEVAEFPKQEQQKDDTDSSTKAERFEKRDSYIFQSKLKGGYLPVIGCFVL
ncbi:hypothetical protein P4377_24820 [Bacillus thuringiensis]|nr:hypothetical protein [Bacillus thuringiensis]